MRTMWKLSWLRCSAALAIFGLSTLTACGDSGHESVAQHTSLPSSPAPFASVPSSCTPDFGINRVKELFAAFSSGDEQWVSQLIRAPAPGQDGLEISW